MTMEDVRKYEKTLQEETNKKVMGDEDTAAATGATGSES